MRTPSLITTVCAALIAVPVLYGASERGQTQGVGAAAASQRQPDGGQTRQRRPDGQTLSEQMKRRNPVGPVGGSRPVQVTLVTSPDQIASSPAQFYGVPVSVHAQVAELYNPHVFTLEGDAWWDYGDEVVVLVRVPQPGTRLEEDDYVTVTGMVRQFVRAQLERDYDWFEEVPDVEAELEGRPVLIADLVRTSDGATIATPEQPLTRVLIASARDIAHLPGRFFGSIVSVEAEVEDVWSPRAFTLDEDEWFAGPDVLVFNPYPIATAGGNREGTDVRVIGIVRPFIVSEFEADYEWFDGTDYTQVALDELEGRPAIVASSIVDTDNRDYVQFRPVIALDVTAADIEARMGQRRTGDGRGGQRGRQERGTSGQEPR